MKRLLPSLLALCCLFFCLPAVSAGYDAFFTTPDQAVNDRGEHFCYKLKDGAAVLTDYWVEDTARQPAVIEIPAFLNGHPVTAIGPYAFDAGFYQSPDELRIRYDTQSVERIIVPEGVTELQPSAFCDAYGVQAISLPSTLARIAPGSCSSGTSPEIDFPNGNENYRMENGFLIDNRTEGLIYCNPSARSQPLPRVRRIETAALHNYNSWQKVLEFPDSVEFIGSSNAFGCVNLETIIIPGSVAEIADFSLCRNSATSIILHEGLKKIGAYAFSDTNVKQANLPSTVEWIGYGAFPTQEPTPAAPNPDCVWETKAQFYSRQRAAFTRDFNVLYTYEEHPARKLEILQGDEERTYLRVTMQDGSGLIFLSISLPEQTTLDEQHADDSHILMRCPISAEKEYDLTFEYISGEWRLTSLTDGQNWTADVSDGVYTFHDCRQPSEVKAWQCTMADRLTELYISHLQQAENSYRQALLRREKGDIDAAADLPLYYNTEGGQYYHLDPNCPSIAEKFRPIRGIFLYSQLTEMPYRFLKRCRICGAPERPLPGSDQPAPQE